MPLASSLLLLAALWAQAPATDKPTEISGSVIDSATKQPVEGATVVLVRMGVPGDSYGDSIYRVAPGTGLDDPESRRMAMLTGSDGLFRFAVKAPAKVMLFVTAKDYVRTRLSFGTASMVYELEAGQPRSGVVLAIDAEAALQGRIIDTDTLRGVAGAVVTPHQYTAQSGYRMFSPAGQPAKTDEKGSFELAGLAPGEYYLVVRQDLQEAFRIPAPDETPAQAEKRGYARSYYPGVVRLEESTPITVLPGAKMQGLDIKLRKQRIASIRGRVLGGEDLNGEPVNLALTEHRHGLDSQSFFRVASAKISPGSTFQLDNVPAGSYALSAMNETKQPAERRRATTYLEVAEDNISGADLHLSRGFTITGKVRTAPAEGDSPEEQKPFEARMNVSISSTRSAMYAMDPPNVVNREDGTFTVPGVFPDECRVGLFPLPKGYRVAEVIYNGAPGDWNRFQVKPGEERHALEVVLRPAASGIQVTVTDGTRPVEGAMVQLAKEPVTAASLVLTAQPVATGKDGVAAFTGLLAGKYRVAAFPRGSLWREDAGLQSLMSNAQQVAVGAGAPAPVQIRVQGR